MSSCRGGKAGHGIMWPILALCILFIWSVQNCSNISRADPGGAGQNQDPQQTVKAIEALSNAVRGQKEMVQVVNEQLDGLAGKVGGNGNKLNRFDSVLYEDPLDDKVELMDFPKEPLTIQTATLCDTKKNIIYSDSSPCSGDNTCEKCAQGSIKRFRQIEAVIRAPKRLKRRLGEMKEQFGPPSPESIVLVMAVNYGQLLLLLNFLCSLERLGLDPSKFLMIVPVDFKTANILSQLGIKHLDPEWTKECKIDTKYTGSAVFVPRGHVDINNVVLLIANDLFINLGYNIILHDVDIAWLRDPREYLLKAGQRRDMLGMSAPYYNAKGGYNTGFVFVRNSTKSRIFMQSFENLAPLKQISDQALFNSIFRHYTLISRKYTV
mmetsp:Transcript_42323/g.67822  ORF Transcript_42323/g.67822 Transcript_42323/m.67822 type:complete len:379 (-) Transcript_42323:873-2009(-)